MYRSEEKVEVKARNLPVDQLSGGERSKTMVSLIGALWDVQNAPFLCLDEWDVGLDDDARPDVERLLLTVGAKITPQLFLVNPTKSSAAADSAAVAVVSRAAAVASAVGAAID